jgi:hypothetical protein
MGVENAYFPMFVSQKVLEREKDHIEGFSPEVAWVTRACVTGIAPKLMFELTSDLGASQISKNTSRSVPRQRQLCILVRLGLIPSLSLTHDDYKTMRSGSRVTEISL